MLVILDTDHLSLLLFPDSEAADRIVERLVAEHVRQLCTTIITYEEQTRGWLARISRARNVGQEIQAYRKLRESLHDFGLMEILDFDEEAAAEYQRLRQMKIRIGSMDLRIAAIALTRGVPILTRNLSDFRKVPGLQVEDWSR